MGRVVPVFLFLCFPQREKERKRKREKEREEERKRYVVEGIRKKYATETDHKR